MLQIIDREGDIINRSAVLPSKGSCLNLFRWMMFLRTFDTAVLALQREGRISFCNPSTGQEASQIGTAFALSSQDWVFPSYRVAGVYLYRKGSPLPLLNQLYGNNCDLSRGRQLPMHFGDRALNFLSVSSPVGTQITQAVGLAFAAKLTKQPVIAIAYFGDGATSTNDFHAALNLAGVLRVPAVFYCENNQYAISVPYHRQTASESIAIKGSAYGVDSVQIDGNDILAVYMATKQAADRARNGDGPVLIEAVTYRLGLHSSSDDPSLYRTKAEEAEWKEKDPILRFRKFLQKQNWWTAAWEDDVQTEQSEIMQKAISEAERHPSPPPESMFEDVWAELPPRLKQQQSLFMEMLSKNENGSSDFKSSI